MEDQLVLYPGMDLQLNVQLGQQSQPVYKALLSQMEERGIAINPNAQTRLTVTSQRGTTGEKIGVVKGRRTGLNPFRRPTGPLFDQQKIDVIMRLTDASGNLQWEAKRSVAMRSFGALHTKPQNAQAELSRELSENYDRFIRSGDFAKQSLPTYVFRSLEEILAGRSMLKYDGLDPYTPPKTRAPGQNFRPGRGFGPPFPRGASF